MPLGIMALKESALAVSLGHFAQRGFGFSETRCQLPFAKAAPEADSIPHCCCATTSSSFQKKKNSPVPYGPCRLFLQHGRETTALLSVEHRGRLKAGKRRCRRELWRGRGVGGRGHPECRRRRLKAATRALASGHHALARAVEVQASGAERALLKMVVPQCRQSPTAPPPQALLS